MIELKVIICKKFVLNGVYDTGSNVSLINAKTLKLKINKSDFKKAKLRTINGVNETDHLIKIKVKIFNIEKDVDVFVIDNENFKYDFLIGLDLIKQFYLSQDENLCIVQKGKESNCYNNNCKKDNPEKAYITEKNKNKEGIHEINFNECIDTNNFKAITDHLSVENRKSIINLVNKYKQIFAKDKFDIGTVQEYEARIDLTIDKYCSKRPYKCTMEDKKEIEQQIARLLKRNLIEESYSPFAAPVTLAFKKDENKKSRLCIDFRELNKIIIPQSQPFPRIEDLVTKTRNCQFFSKLDINSAFWSIPLRIEDRSKTGFVTQDGHYQWTCLPFGMKTSPAIFQRILSNIIRKYELTNFTVNYIDDILIFSKTFEKHLEHLKKLLDAIIKEGFKLKLSKCFFATDTVDYLGHIIGYNTVRPMTDNLKSIMDFPTPTTQKNIRQFLGKINFYHEYVPKVATILEPLHRLLRKNQKFIWSQECQKAFNYLKNYLCKTPILTIYDPKLPIRIYTDGSIIGLGAVLKQPQSDNNEKPVAYFSKKLTSAQSKKKAIYLEALAIKEAIKFWQYWLIGRSFEVYSDHKPLKDLNIKARPDEELGDLTYYMSQFDFKVIYNPGKFNIEADCLSRNPVLEADENEEDILKTVNIISLESIKKDQEKNKEIKSQKAMCNEHNLYLRNGKIILSEVFSRTLILKVHKEFNHIGISQMKIMIKKYYTAKNLLGNIKDACRKCEICIQNKSRGQYKYGLLSQLGPAKKPYEIMSIDTIGGFGGSRSTKKYMHLLVDHFTRFAHIITSKTQSGSDFIKLVKKVADNEQIGKILVDQYPGINSYEFKEYIKNKNIQLIFTAVNAPFSNGLNERLNQTLVNRIRCKVNETSDRKAWTTIAQQCVQKYNETVHTVTKFSPKYLMEGTMTTLLPKELATNQQLTNLKENRIKALQNSLKYHEYNKKVYDRNRKDHVFQTGEMVYVENGNRLNRKKLDKLRIGPYKILEKISDTMYRVNTGFKKEESNIFHYSKLIPLEDDAEQAVEDVSLSQGGEI